MEYQHDLLPEPDVELLTLDLMRDQHIADSPLWKSNFTEFIEVVEAAFAREGVDDSKALARLAVGALALQVGGGEFYLPRGERIRAALQRKKIWDEFNGKNLRDLARKYRMTTSHIYAILKEQRKLHIRSIQPELDLR